MMWLSMGSICTRRQFCLQTICCGMLLGGIRMPAALSRRPPDQQASDPVQFEVLSVAIDEIIPQRDGMPSATSAGGLQYLQLLGWQYPAIQEELHNFLLKLSRASSLAFKTELRALEPGQRLQVFQQLEKDDPAAFASFVSYVYEAYYTRPQVLGLISCPTRISSGDDLETLLAPVRSMKPLYREAR
jgi:hypothetical protein